MATPPRGDREQVVRRAALLPASACSRSWSSPTTWICCSSTRCSPTPAAVRRRDRTLGGASPRRCRSTATSPATPTWPSAPRSCSASSCRRTSTCRTWRRASADFWRRWHMSLSTWLRDYLYFPLGGSRGGAGADVLQSDAGLHPVRPVARRGVDLARLRRVQRRADEPASRLRSRLDRHRMGGCAVRLDRVETARLGGNGVSVPRRADPHSHG